MKSVLIIVCSRCGGFLLAKAGEKTRTCPYCGSKVNVEKAKKVASAESSYQASETLRKLKRDAFLKKKKV